MANHTLAFVNAGFGTVHTRYYINLALFHRVTSFDLVQFLFTPSRVKKRRFHEGNSANKVGEGRDEKREPESFKATTSFFNNKFLAIPSLPMVLKQSSNNNLSQPS